MSGGPRVPNPIRKLMDVISSTSTWSGQSFQTNKGYLSLCPVLPTRARFVEWLGCLGDRLHVQLSTCCNSIQKANRYHFQLLNLVRSIIPDQQGILGFMSSFTRTRARFGGWLGCLGDRVHIRWSTRPKSKSKANGCHFQHLNLVRSINHDQQGRLEFMFSFTNKSKIWWMTRMFRR